MQQANQGQSGVINKQPSSNQNLSAKEIEQIKEMQKWEQVRKQRREENGIPQPGIALLGYSTWNRLTSCR
jgi:hypothetical protein